MVSCHDLIVLKKLLFVCDNHVFPSSLSQLVYETNLVALRDMEPVILYLRIVELVTNLIRITSASVFHVKLVLLLTSFVVVLWCLSFASEFRSRFTLHVLILFLVRFGLLSGHLLGNSCSVDHMFSLYFDFL